MSKVKLNINQRRLISEGLINLSIAIISIGIIAPIISKTKIDNDLLTVISLSTILSILMISFSLELIKK